MQRLLSLTIAALVLVASTAAAGTLPSAFPKVATPTVLPAGEAMGAPDDEAGSPAAGGTTYEALAVGASFLETGALSPIDNLPYVEYGDDCHLTFVGWLTTFTMGYYKPPPGQASALVTFYENDASDGIIGPVLAGPYLVSALPAGLNTVVVTVPDSPFLTEHVWVAVQFAPDTAGLVIAGGPPTVGTSHDVYVDTGLTTPPPGLVFFGGDPVANFMLAIEVDGTVPVQTVTWGHLKALYLPGQR